MPSTETWVKDRIKLFDWAAIEPGVRAVLPLTGLDIGFQPRMRLELTPGKNWEIDFGTATVNCTSVLQQCLST